jgi:CRISPR-associated exonuclease Cas4
VATCPLDTGGAKNIASVRNAEAAEVAALCERLIGNLQYRNDRNELVCLKPSNIALLAPSSKDLWRYERALETRRLPFASSAGKGLLHRQEVQDLLTLARTLADGSDTLAFGAFMRGPLVGLTEEELLDVTASLVSDQEADQLPRFTINTDPSEVGHPVAREALSILRDLRRRAWTTTPSLLLGEAVERLMIRPILSAREENGRARAAANVERFLELAREYDVLGLKRLVHDVSNEWALGVSQRTEGRVDAEGAIEIVTMHSSKGLEWPVVILINNGSGFHPPSEFVHRPEDDTLHWVLGEVQPPELARALAAESQIWASERQRLIYVACTRARELLVIPEIPAMSHKTWSGVIATPLTDVPDLSLVHFAPHALVPQELLENGQTGERFIREEDTVRSASRPLLWLRPSDQDPDRTQTAEGVVVDEAEAPDVPVPVGAGRLRGLILHKLMEEVLTGELLENLGAISRRSKELLHQLPTTQTVLPEAEELAHTVIRTLAMPDIARLRSRLVPEFPLYGLHSAEQVLVPLAGRADAVLLENGRPSIVLDWKSDIAPKQEDVDDHAIQLRDYLNVTGASRGGLVYMTPGVVQWIDAIPSD